MPVIPARHRGQRFYRIFLGTVSAVLLCLNSVSIGDLEYLNGRPVAYMLIHDSAYARLCASIMVPNTIMILMYCVLVDGRHRLSSQRLHSIVRVFFALALVVGLVQHTATTYREGIEKEKYLREFTEENYWPYISFVKTQFCDKKVTGEGWKLARCQVEASRNILYLISAVLVLVELVVGFRVEADPSSELQLGSRDAWFHRLMFTKPLSAVDFTSTFKGQDPTKRLPLTEALKTISTLTTLDLGGTSTGDNGAQAPGEAIKTNSTLTSLSLRCNKIGPNGTEALRQVSTTTRCQISH
ncbi:hypothetical protein BGZ82_000375 [Podila clonocystis]|nr:hypothetical protein BGZ82_000375 [Podila clonocystis]